MSEETHPSSTGQQGADESFDLGGGETAAAPTSATPEAVAADLAAASLEESPEASETSSGPASGETASSDAPGADEPAAVKKKKKKSVGFAAPPPDLTEHHKRLREIEKEKLKSNPFHKIPPELSYLEKKPEGPKPLPSFSDLNKFGAGAAAEAGAARRPRKELGDLMALTIKDISVVNKQTRESLSFHYPVIDRPIPGHKMIVDVKYASLNSMDLGKINKYGLNVSEQKLGLGYEFVGEITDLGKDFVEYDSEYKVGQTVVGCVNPLDRKGSLSTSILVNPKKDVVIPVTEEQLAALAELKVEVGDEKGSEFGVDDASEQGERSESNAAAGAAETASEEGVAASESSEASSAPASAPASSAATKRVPLAKRASDFPIDPELTPMAKLSAFPVLYARAKSVLAHSHPAFLKNKTASILIHGADTNLGLTLFQLLNSSVYAFLDRLQLILVTRESTKRATEEFVKKYTRYDPSRAVEVSVISFDSFNDEDLVLPGEKTPVLYKKPDLFACEVLDALISRAPLAEGSAGVSKAAFNELRLDTIVDIVGGAKYFQTSSIKYDKLADLSFPFLARLAPGTKLGALVSSSTKEPFLVKLLKPKARGSSYVSCCRFGIALPSYSVDELFQYGTGSGEYVNPWNSKWATGIANSWLSTYNYYNHMDLEIKREWIAEGLGVYLDGQLRFRIDVYSDWRNNYKGVISKLKRYDQKVVFKIEDF